MPTLLQQMQEDATDDGVPVATLLRRALILSRRLDYQPLREWAERELEGYPERADLPPYRAYRRCQVVGDFNGLGGARINSQPLQASAVEEGHRAGLFGIEYREGVPTYEAMVDVGEDATLAFPWSMDVVAYYQAEFIRGWGLANARRLPGAGDIQQLLGAVRTRLLNFTLEIEEADLEPVSAASVPRAEVGKAFDVYIMGDNNVVNAAGRDARQDVVVAGPAWEALRNELHELGLPETEVAALEAALTDDAVLDLPIGTIGPAAARWLARVNDAIAKGVLALPSEVAASMIAAEILKFLGAA